MTIDLNLPKNPKADDLVPVLRSLQEQLVALEQRLSKLEPPRPYEPPRSVPARKTP